MNEPQQINVTVRRQGCGCGTFLAALLILGFVQIGAEWVGKHPAATAMIAVAAFLAAAGGYLMWNDRRA